MGAVRVRFAAVGVGVLCSAVAIPVIALSFFVFVERVLVSLFGDPTVFFGIAAALAILSAGVPSGVVVGLGPSSRPFLDSGIATLLGLLFLSVVGVAVAHSPLASLPLVDLWIAFPPAPELSQYLFVLVLFPAYATTGGFTARLLRTVRPASA